MEHKHTDSYIHTHTQVVKLSLCCMWLFDL
uniref:Uncharacterized protein n=1 Tax=Anguilla anguilla TaxID=7936 RepID=A0A0E9QXZ3_ANGAN